MRNWRDVLLSPDSKILDALQIIDAGSMQIALVVDADGKLVGTVTDGDVRRGILRKVPLDSSVASIMTTHPTTAHFTEDRESILTKLRARRLRQIPIVDDEGRVVDMESLEDFLETSKRANWVVLMAGGTGSRLSPLTDDCPKPLLKVGDKPLLETIIQNFLSYGFQRFFISVNYKAEMVKDYFGDGSRWGAEIRYLEEKSRLGTAGCLGLLPERPSEPFLVMNGDLLTKVNFHHLLDFHIDHEAFATMCVREYAFQVPYGVATIDNNRVVAIDEKPIHKFFVNAGIYVLDPAAIDFIPSESSFDMPTLLEHLIAEKLETTVFPIREYWLDVGRVDDFERANGEFSKVFQ